MDEAQLHKKFQTFGTQDNYAKVERLFDFTHGGLQILDAGSGSGLLDEHLRKLGNKVTGLDIAVSEANEIRSATGEFIQCDLNEKWPVLNSKFDVVICTDVAEHLYDPGHVLREAGRVLKTSGKLIFGVPNHFDLRQRVRMLFGRGIIHWDDLQYNEPAWLYTHIRFFTLKDLEGMFKASPFKIEMIQFNFMGGGLVPSRLTPKYFRLFLLRLWPGLFAGKYIFLLGREAREGVIKKIHLDKTTVGM